MVLIYYIIDYIDLKKVKSKYYAQYFFFILVFIYLASILLLMKVRGFPEWVMIWRWKLPLKPKLLDFQEIFFCFQRFRRIGVCVVFGEYLIRYIFVEFFFNYVILIWLHIYLVNSEMICSNKNIRMYLHQIKKCAWMKRECFPKYFIKNKSTFWIE